MARETQSMFRSDVWGPQRTWHQQITTFWLFLVLPLYWSQAFGVCETIPSWAESLPQETLEHGSQSGTHTRCDERDFSSVVGCRGCFCRRRWCHHVPCKRSGSYPLGNFQINLNIQEYRPSFARSGLNLTHIKQCFWAIPKNRGIQKMEIQFFSAENNSMSTSFGKKFVTL